MQGPGSRVTLAGLAALVATATAVIAAGPAAAAPVARAGCAPSVTALPLPPGATRGTVLAAAGAYAAGSTRGAGRFDLATVWHWGRSGWTVTSLAALAPIGTKAASQATGVNQYGEVVVTSWATGLGTAFVYDNGTLHRLRDAQGGTVATATAVSATGVIVGGTQDPATGASRATEWPSWSATPVPVAPSDAHGTYAWGVDEAGAVAGQFGSGGNFGLFARLWRADGSTVALESVLSFFHASTALDTDTAAGRTVGYSWVSGAVHPVVWDSEGRLTVLPLFADAAQGQANSVSSTGTVVGSQSVQGAGPAHAFLWPGSGPVRTLLPLSRNWTDAAGAAAVDDRGTVYGASVAVTGGAVQPTVWTCARQQSFVPPTGGVAAA